MIRPLKLFFSVCECKYMTVILHINQKINSFLSFENSKFKNSSNTPLNNKYFFILFFFIMRIGIMLLSL